MNNTPKYKRFIIAAGILNAGTAAAASIVVSDSISLHGIDISTTIGGTTTTSNVARLNADGTINNTAAIYNTANQNPAGADTYQYGIRQRQNTTQLDRSFRSFLQFDVSAISAAELADPTFTATFTVDYVTHLNNLNAGFNADLGQITGGAWDSTTNLPAFSFSTGSTNLGNLVTNTAASSGAIPGITLDITSLVQGWADGSIDNFGLTFTTNTNISNSGYFENATIETAVTSVPEPSSVLLLSLTCGFLGRRRRNS